MARRFSETNFNNTPDEHLTALLNRKPSIKKDLSEKKLKVADIHYKLQEKQYNINRMAKLIFQTSNLFLDTFSGEFKQIVESLKTTLDDDLSAKTGTDLKQIILFSGPSSNSYLTSNAVTRNKSKENLNKLIKNLKENKDDSKDTQYSEFIDGNFTQIFKYNLANLTHVARAFLRKEDFNKIDKLFYKLNNLEVLNLQYISKCDSLSRDMHSLVSKFINDEFTSKKNAPSKINNLLVVKGRNFTPGSIIRINKDNYKNYWRGLTKTKKIDVITNEGVKADIAKDNVLFLQEY